jgi:hypothetical protein
MVNISVNTGCNILNYHINKRSKLNARIANDINLRSFVQYLNIAYRIGKGFNIDDVSGIIMTKMQ